MSEKGNDLESWIDSAFATKEALSFHARMYGLPTDVRFWESLQTFMQGVKEIEDSDHNLRTKVGVRAALGLALYSDMRMLIGESRNPALYDDIKEENDD